MGDPENEQRVPQKSKVEYLDEKNGGFTQEEAKQVAAAAIQKMFEDDVQGPASGANPRVNLELLRIGGVTKKC